MKRGSFQAAVGDVLIERTEAGLRKAMGRIEAALGGNSLGLVLDLRNNPGGFLREAIRVGSQFLPRGEIILQEKDASGKVNSV